MVSVPGPRKPLRFRLLRPWPGQSRRPDLHQGHLLHPPSKFGDSATAFNLKKARKTTGGELLAKLPM
jgi:hypothetical protein